MPHCLIIANNNLLRVDGAFSSGTCQGLSRRTKFEPETQNEESNRTHQKNRHRFK